MAVIPLVFLVQQPVLIQAAHQPRLMDLDILMVKFLMVTSEALKFLLMPMTI